MRISLSFGCMSTEHKKSPPEPATPVVVAPMQLAKRAATRGSWKPGEAPVSGGRPRGAVGKITRTMKNAVVAAAEELGRLNTDEWAVAMPSRRVDGRRFSRPRPPGLL